LLALTVIEALMAAFSAEMKNRIFKPGTNAQSD